VLAAVVTLALVVAAIALHVYTGDTDLTSWWYGNASLALVLLVPGALIVHRRPGNPIGWLLYSASFTSALCGFGREYLAYGFLGGTAPGWLWFGWFTDSLYTVSMISLPLVLMLFPDGRALSRRARPLLLVPVVALACSLFGSLLIKGSAVHIRGRALVNPAADTVPDWLANGALGLGTLLFFASLVLAIVALILRYRRSGREVRQQMKWVVWAGAIAAVELGTELVPGNQVAPFTGTVATGLLTGAVCVAILRHRLFDIDVVINRTLVYVALTVLVVGGYVGVVAMLSAAVGQPVHPGQGLAATALIAVAFSPVRHRIQRGVDRLLYGERRNPYGVMTQLGRRLEASGGRGELAVVVETVTGALKLPYAAICDPTGAMLVATGTPRGTQTTVPLAYHGEPVGTLVVENRTPAAAFSRSERRLLADLARQVGAAVHAVRLSADLQASRQRLVTAKEEERRRLRRDLHDGLGPKLAALGLKLDTARILMDTRPDESKSVLGAVSSDIRETIDDVRRLVYGLRPPALDELGLLGALRECAARFDSSAAGGLVVTVRSPQRLPALPAAVEVATYLIVNEAVTNVVRHARARHCQVQLALDGGLHVTVTDDGVGLGPGWRPGVGTGSMAERAAELGGTLRIDSDPDRSGTEVDALLPLAAGGDGG
jgi:signal transduction histidine kinase